MVDSTANSVDRTPVFAAQSPRILLDNPSEQPALGFGGTAAALAQIVSDSPARFAVGIFGGWGSGKTTLMRAIRRALPDTVATVDFNAWRFEREPVLLVPLLDTIRSALLEWANAHGPAESERIRALARRLGRVVRGLATGVSAEVEVGGLGKVSYDVGRAIDAFTAPDDPERPQSLYVAAFRELQEAFAEVTGRGAWRVVVFVDDLDRCLPANALEVLESMKLFFDLEGFVFVVGLDDAVVQRAVRARFLAGVPGRRDGVGEHSAAAASAAIDEQLERAYVEKIFQVPYRLPLMMDRQLDDLLEAMVRDADLPEDQLKDLRTRVLPYLRHVAVQGRVNPREVKRFINTYTLQMLVRPELDRSTMLALQTLSSRHDWRQLYDTVLADSPRFVAALEQYRRDRDPMVLADLTPGHDMPGADLRSFLESEAAEPLIGHGSLDAYLSSLEATRVTHHVWLATANRAMVRLVRALQRLEADEEPDGDTMVQAGHEVRAATTELRSAVVDSSPAVVRLLDDITAATERLPTRSDPKSDLSAQRKQTATAAAGLRLTVERLYTELRRIR